MATRATIVLEIPEDRNGREYKFEGGNVFKYSTPNTTIPEDVRYVSIYSHFDGGVDSLGTDLVMGGSGFDAIMSRIICGGSCSYPGSPYHGNRDEEWDGVKPKFSKELPEITQSYQYIYKTDNKWYVRSEYDPKYLELTCISEVNYHIDDVIKKLKNDVECLKYDVINRIDSLMEELNKVSETVDKLEKNKK